MPDLTPLETISGFDEDIRKKLAEYWITSAEEFVTAARSSNRQHGNGLQALVQVLGREKAQIEALLQAADVAIPPHFAFAPETELEVGTGAIFTGMEVVEEPPAFDVSPPPLPPEINLAGALPPPLNQGKRNTCVPFTLVAMYQHASGDSTDLSEQFIYWACKEKDGVRGDVGTRPDLAMRVLVEQGVCIEVDWPYNDVPDNNNAGQGPPPEQAVERALQRRITGFTALAAKDVRRIQAALAQGQMVLFGLPINEHWTSTYQSRALGRVRRPFPGEATLGGHAMCAVGYRDDPQVPGGGYFIVRNSWGTDWGKDNPDGPGYAHVPYRLVFEDNLAAFVIDGVVAQAIPEEQQATKVAPTTTPPAAAPTAAPTVTGNTSRPGPDLQAIYAEARELQQRFNALVDQLSMLVANSVQGSAAPIDSAELPSPGGTGRATSAPDISPPAETIRYTPLVIIAEPDPERRSDLIANGVDGINGQPLVWLDTAAASAMARATPANPILEALHQRRANSTSARLETLFGPDPNQLEAYRWAVVVNGDDDAALIQALLPLIQLRSAQQGITLPTLEFRAGENCAAWLNRVLPDPATPWQQRPPVLIYEPGESSSTWLIRHGVALGASDAPFGLPFYLLIAGRPGPLTANDTAYIPFSFQYELDLLLGVGRLCFNDARGQHNFTAYASYAEQIVTFEQAPPAPRKHVVYFGTRHAGDPASELSAEQLVMPLAQGYNDDQPLAAALGYSQRVLLGDDATCANLERVLSGADEGGPATLLVTATHGLGLPCGHPRQLRQQGALVCQDWPGFGTINREHWFAAEDLPEQAQVAGMIAVCVNSYSVGCPQTDPFLAVVSQAPPAIAPYAFVTQLPQHLLTRGALAVLGYVDRAWHINAYPGLGTKAEAFGEALTQVLAGKRLGFATDSLNLRQAVLATRLTNELESAAFGKQLVPTSVAALWIARNDASAYMLIGDPAVRLPG